MLVERFGEDELAIHGVGRLGPSVGADGIVVGFSGDVPLEEAQHGLPHASVPVAKCSEFRGRARQPCLDLVLPSAHEALPHNPTDVGIVDGAAEVVLDLRYEERVGVVARQCADALGDQKSIPEAVEV